MRPPFHNDEQTLFALVEVLKDIDDPYDVGAG